jgi:hypothetical protein
MAEARLTRALWPAVVAPWGAADFNLPASGWGLVGSTAIGFSIGCVCRVSSLLARRH